MSKTKNECPVCYSSMRREKGEYICPDCGYHLCDADYNGRDPYSTDHAHHSNYTTSSTKTTYNVPRPTTSASAGTRPQSGTPVQPTPLQQALQRTVETANSYQQSKNNGQASSAKRVVRIVVIVYVLFVLFSVLISILSGFLGM